MRWVNYLFPGGGGVSPSGAPGRRLFRTEAVKPATVPEWAAAGVLPLGCRRTGRGVWGHGDPRAGPRVPTATPTAPLVHFWGEAPSSPRSRVWEAAPSLGPRAGWAPGRARGTVRLRWPVGNRAQGRGASSPDPPRDPPRPSLPGFLRWGSFARRWVGLPSLRLELTARAARRDIEFTSSGTPRSRCGEQHPSPGLADLAIPASHLQRGRSSAGFRGVEVETRPTTVSPSSDLYRVACMWGSRLDGRGSWADLVPDGWPGPGSGRGHFGGPAPGWAGAPTGGSEGAPGWPFPVLEVDRGPPGSIPGVRGALRKWGTPPLGGPLAVGRPVTEGMVSGGGPSTGSPPPQRAHSGPGAGDRGLRHFRVRRGRWVGSQAPGPTGALPPPMGTLWGENHRRLLGPLGEWGRRWTMAGEGWGLRASYLFLPEQGTHLRGLLLRGGPAAAPGPLPSGRKGLGGRAARI